MTHPPILHYLKLLIGRLLGILRSATGLIWTVTNRWVPIYRGMNLYVQTDWELGTVTIIAMFVLNP